MGKKIALLDDCKIVRLKVEKVFRQRGYQCLVTERITEINQWIAQGEDIVKEYIEQVEELWSMPLEVTQ